MFHNGMLLAVAALAAQLSLADEAGIVRLAGTPEQIGAAFGEMNRQIIAADMDATYLTPAAKAGISRATLIERSAPYVRFAEKYAPHWLVETRAIARAAGVDEDLYVAFIDGQARNRFLHAAARPPLPCDGMVECTSYAVSRDHAQGGAILFHKTRDAVDRPQIAPIVESSLEGIHKFIAVTDGSRIRCSMMINDQGLAGACDSATTCRNPLAGLKVPFAAPKYRGIMAGTILRYIAERASTCAEALAIVEDFVAKGYYASGDHGSHWLFVDREGVILEVCNNASQVRWSYHADKPTYFSWRRDSEPVRRLREADKVDFRTFHGASRERPILAGNSIAGMTVEIDPDRPDLLTCAWIALPARVVAFPVFMGQSRAPTCLVDGSAYELGKKSAHPTERWEAMEGLMHAEKEALKQQVKEGIAAGNPEAPHVETMDQWSDTQARKIVESLAKPD